MKNLNNLQEYLSNLAVLNIKLHNIHWNVVGPKFMDVHNFTEGMYNQFFADLDEVAELLKTKNQMPLSNMKDYLAHASIEELEARDFREEESLKIVLDDLKSMKSLAANIRNIADEEGDFETVAMFEDFISSFSKNIWFLSSMLK